MSLQLMKVTLPETPLPLQTNTPSRPHDPTPRTLAPEVAGPGFGFHWDAPVSSFMIKKFKRWTSLETKQEDHGARCPHTEDPRERKADGTKDAVTPTAPEAATGPRSPGRPPLCGSVSSTPPRERLVENSVNQGTWSEVQF